MNVIKIGNIGFCQGVKNAIDMTLKIKRENPNKNVYVYGQLVHNTDVIKTLANNNIITLDTKLSDEELFSGLQKGDILIFPADGHKKETHDLAKSKGLIIFDTVCGLVKRNSDILAKEVESGNDCIYIGMAHHDETKVALSISEKVHLYEKGKDFNYKTLNIDNPVVLVQTTLSSIDVKNEFEKIKENLPKARIMSDVCNASLVRQQSIMNYKGDASLIYVVGSENSSNTNRLVDIGKIFHKDIEIKRIENVDNIDILELKKHQLVGVISGTSAPNEVVDNVISFIKNLN